MASIRFDSVEKTYANGHRALRTLDLEIRDGEFMVLVGPSGCGKSTALRLVAGLESPTRGRILLGDRDVTALPPQQRDIAMVFQSYALYPHKTVRDNLAFGLRMRGAAEPLIAERVTRTAKALGLDGFLERRPAQLSGGQRQRVALGRAIAREPRAFLLDEPLSNLDARLRVEMRAELVRLHRQLSATMLYVTHDQEEAMTLGDRVTVLREGVLQQLAPPMEIYRRPANVFVAGFLGSPSMNFFRCRLDDEAGNLVLQSPAFRISLDRGMLSSVPAEVILGIRPQDVRLAGSDDADATVRVEVIQSLGSDLVLHLKLPAGDAELSLTTVTSADKEVCVDDRIAIRFERHRLHLFDIQEEKRLN